MKHTLSRLRYAPNLTSLKHGYEGFLTIFKKNYPLGTEVQMINHYINHYKTSIRVADRSIDRNQKSLSHLSNEEYEEIVIRTENHVFDYGNMVKWLEEKKESVLKSGQDTKDKPELNESLILFSSPKIIDDLHNELKGYFQESEAELLKALKGEHLNKFLLFPHNQNKFVEVFKRLRYNGFLCSTPKEINNWICSNFTYIRTQGNKKEVKNFNENTIKTLLTNTNKERHAEPTPKDRICTPDWLPHYWSNELKNK